MDKKQWLDLYDTDRQIEAFDYAQKLLLRATAPKSKLQVVLIIGNGGVIDLPFKRRDKLYNAIKKQAAKLGHDEPTSIEFRRLVWHYNEILRDISANVMPRSVLVYLAHLILERLCSLIITPNYDLFLQSICDKLNVEYALNPVNTGSKFHDGYGKNIKSNILIYKYHGDAGHIIFESCREVFRLPCFPVIPFSPLSDQLLKMFALPLPYHSLAEAGQLHYYRGESHITGWPDHYIDFNFPDIPHSQIFSKEINGAIKAIDNINPNETAGFLIVGFAGRWVKGKDRISEEIVHPLIRKIKEGVPATMIFNPSKQDMKFSWLAEEIYNVNPNQLWLGDVEDCLLLLFNSIERLKPALSLDLAWRSEKLFA